MGALKRPSRGANVPSGLRNEVKQRALPRAARQDPYAIPESPEKIRRPKLKQPAAEAPEFSPLRKQRLPATSTLQTNDHLPSDPPSVDDHGVLPAHATSPRRSPRKQAMTNMRPAEESVGSAKRHASPVVKPSQVQDAHENSEGLFVSPEPEVAAVASTASSTNSRKRGRPRKADGKHVSIKRSRLSDQAIDEPNGRHHIVEDNETVLARPTKIRLSGIHFPAKQAPEESHDEDDAPTDDAGDDGQLGGEDGHEQEVPASKVAKKKQPARVLKAKKIKAAKSKAQTKTLPKTYVAENELSEDSESDGEVDAYALGRQYLTIKNICQRTLPLIDGIGDGEELDGHIEDIRSVCRSFRITLSQLREDPDDLELLPELPVALGLIQNEVETLCGEDAERDNHLQSCSIYYCLIPALVRVLWSLIRCYKALDSSEDTDGISVTIPHMIIIQRLVSTINRLGEKAKLYVRPDTELAVVQPVTNGVLEPLKRVTIRLQRAVVEYENRQQEKVRAQHERARKAAELAELQERAEEAARLAEEHEQVREAAELAEAKAQAEKARWQNLEKKWDDLHAKRRRCDCSGVMTSAKRTHLKTTDFLQQPRPRPEIDQDGNTFTRLEVFRPRMGLPPAIVDRVRSQTWPKRSQQALVAGLMKWAGDPLVFERIFSAYCWRHEPLHDYNVSEIVIKAAQLKQVLEEDCDTDSEDWWWVSRIPDWTKPDTILRQMEDYELD